MNDRKTPAPRPETPDQRRAAMRNARRALVLQGGGALGAYQAGVYAAASETQRPPDWIAAMG